MSTPVTAEKLLERVRALLAQAEHPNTSDVERDAYNAKAEQLILKHNVDRAKLAAAAGGRDDEKLVIVTQTLNGVYADAIVQGIAHVVDAFTADLCYQRMGASHRKIFLVGYASEVAQVNALVASLHLQSLAALKAWNRDNRWELGFGSPMEKFKARREYVLGFFAGAASRVKAARETVVNAQRGESLSTELALRDRQDVVSAFMRDELNSRETKSRMSRGASWARADGYVDGKRADVGTGRVGDGGRAALR